MAKIEQFEEIISWQKGMELCDAIYAITMKDAFSRDYALKDQIRKCAISIPSNISEGFERESNNQFIYFLLIAKASAGELRTQLNIAKNQKYISEEEFQKIKEQCINVSKIISGFISYLREKRRVKELSKLS